MSPAGPVAEPLDVEIILHDGDLRSRVNQAGDLLTIDEGIHYWIQGRL